MTRLAAAALVTVAGLTTFIAHHGHKRPSSGQSDALATVIPLDRASRFEDRPPLPDVKAGREPSQGVTPRPVPNGRRPSRPASRSGIYADTTMYCSTGNRNAAGRWPQIGDVAVIDRSIPFGTNVIIGGRTYTVEDWIGSGSQFDIFGGDDDGCEQRALDYGRRHLEVVIER